MVSGVPVSQATFVTAGIDMTGNDDLSQTNWKVNEHSLHHPSTTAIETSSNQRIIPEVPIMTFHRKRFASDDDERQSQPRYSSRGHDFFNIFKRLMIDCKAQPWQNIHKLSSCKLSFYSKS